MRRIPDPSGVPSPLNPRVGFSYQILDKPSSALMVASKIQQKTRHSLVVMSNAVQSVKIFGQIDSRIGQSRRTWSAICSATKEDW